MMLGPPPLAMLVEKEGRICVLRRRHEDEHMRRFQMREKLLSIGSDFWIEDAGGEHAYRTDGKIERDGDTIERISKRWFRVRDTYGVEIDRDEDEALVLAAVVAIEALTD